MHTINRNLFCIKQSEKAKKCVLKNGQVRLFLYTFWQETCNCAVGITGTVFFYCSVYFKLKEIMKTAGIVVIIVGILMLVFTNINFTTEKKVVDLGSLEINKKENNSIGWPVWMGGAAILAGIVLVATDRKNA